MRIDAAGLRDRLAKLSLEEKAGLLTGADFWTLRPAPAAGLGKLVLSDGPSGVRGTVWDERRPSLLFPNSSALAATWDPLVAREAGWLAGAQARDKGVHVLLAPTVNLHRTPLGGRHFECYSEDPLLTSRMAAGFVAGVQSAGVAATVKHFVGNDSETARMSYDARIGERTLRELYLRPFEETVKSGAWLVMAAYNGVNGTTMTENHHLLTGVLKREWGFDGVVVSDWMAVRSTEASANAGMDLAMPGPRGPWGARLVQAVRDGRVAEEVIDDKVLRILRLAARVGVLDGVPGPPPVTTPGDARQRLRGLAARSCVLLRNSGILPLPPVSRIALLGPNAVRLSMQGGGSAHVNPEHFITPYEGLRRALGPDTAIAVHPGVYPHRLLPDLPLGSARDPETGEPGFRVGYRDADGAQLGSENRRAARLVFMGTLPEGTREILVRTECTPGRPGEHAFSVAGAGSYELRVGEVTEKTTLEVSGDDPVEALMRPPEQRVTVTLDDAPVPVEVRHLIGEGALFTAFGLGHAEPRRGDDEELAAAVAAAREADAAIVIVGTDDEVESEGFDRTTLALPGRQDELVSAVAAANPRTVVVVNAGAPVLMPWREDVAAVLWAWLPGQMGGDAIADILTGAAEPGGRLPTTFPASEEDILPVQPVDGRIEYTEEAAIGYRRYRPQDVAYPFGHGLGYTSWSYDAVTARRDGSGRITAEVSLTNTGERAGREVVQCYVTGPDGTRLAGFGTVEAAPGAQVTTAVQLDEPPKGGSLRIGRSVTDLRLAHQLDP